MKTYKELKLRCRGDEEYIISHDFAGVMIQTPDGDGNDEVRLYLGEEEVKDFQKAFNDVCNHFLSCEKAFD